MESATEYMTKLKDLFCCRKARVGVIGLGYVGLPLAVEMANAGFEVIGIDTNVERIAALNQGHGYILDVDDQILSDHLKTERLIATNDYHLVQTLDAISICVPTPLRKSKDPDISFIVQAVKGVSHFQRRGQLIVLESTTYPGTTEEIVLPELQSNGWEAGRDFFLAFSPERVDPGNPIYSTRNTPKIIGGITRNCTEVASTFYQQFIQKVIAVSSTRAAEMVKLLENTFRSVNIALVNEMAMMCDRLHLEIWEIIDAAASKPFGFMPFYPGPGLGGHCIPIDPHYLSWKLRALNYQARFVELAEAINGAMPQYVITKLIDTLNQRGKCVKGSKILILGVAYKRNIDDTRESPALDIIQLLRERGADISFSDPFVSRLDLGELHLQSLALTPEILSRFDAGIIVTDHDSFDYPMIVTNLALTIDTRNATKRLNHRLDKVVLL